MRKSKLTKRHPGWKVTPYTLTATHGNVLCVNGAMAASGMIAPNGGPVEGKRYRAVAFNDDGTGLALLGFPAIDEETGEERGWKISRFRVAPHSARTVKADKPKR